MHHSADTTQDLGSGVCAYPIFLLVQYISFFCTSRLGGGMVSCLQFRRDLGVHVLFQKFREGVGGQRGLARGILHMQEIQASFLCPLVRGGKNFWRIVWALFGGFVCRQPPPANPFLKPLPLIVLIMRLQGFFSFSHGFLDLDLGNSGTMFSAALLLRIFCKQQKSEKERFNIIWGSDRRCLLHVAEGGRQEVSEVLHQASRLLSFWHDK